MSIRITLGLAALGGYVTARLAPSDARMNVFALAAVMLLLGVVTLLQGPQPPQPDWYQPVLMVLGPVGVYVGGMLQMRGAQGSTDVVGQGVAE